MQQILASHGFGSERLGLLHGGLSQEEREPIKAAFQASPQDSPVPFLEGRAKGSDWRTDVAKPLPIDNRTVLLLLEAIQQFQGRTLSYRALDVEQIGYVYEGLLERTVKRTAEVTLELDGTKSAQSPWVKLAELESARLDGAARLAELLQQRSGSSASRVRNDLARPVTAPPTSAIIRSVWPTISGCRRRRN